MEAEIYMQQSSEDSVPRTPLVHITNSQTAPLTPTSCTPTSSGAHDVSPSLMTTPVAHMNTPQGSMCDLNDQCALCLSPLGAKAGIRCSLDEIFHTPCNHWFHKCCIVKSRGSLCDNSHKCPMCRTVLPKGLTPEQARNQRREPENGVFYRDLIINNSQRVREMMRQRLQGQATANVSRRNAAFPLPFRSASEALGDEVENIANAMMDIEVSEAPQEFETDDDDFMSGMCECNHCQRFCENGGRCGRCGEMYCRLCSVLNYDQRDERIFCLTCVAEQRELTDQMQ